MKILAERMSIQQSLNLFGRIDFLHFKIDFNLSQCLTLLS
jgi:hypothetical protein